MSKPKVPLEAIRTLREQTGAPLGDVRGALEEAGGDPAKAREVLQRKGFEAAEKRKTRAAKLGRVESYVHHDGRVAAVVEVNCETDFVARLPEFQQFCRDVAMQVASQNPQYVRKEDVPPDQVPGGQQGKRAEERLREACLLEQPFIKDQGQTMAQYLTALIAKTGEHIVVRRFVRFGLGEELA